MFNVFFELKIKKKTKLVLLNWFLLSFSQFNSKIQKSGITRHFFRWISFLNRKFEFRFCLTTKFSFVWSIFNAFISSYLNQCKSLPFLQKHQNLVLFAVDGFKCILSNTTCCLRPLNSLKIKHIFSGVRSAPSNQFLLSVRIPTCSTP